MLIHDKFYCEGNDNYYKFRDITMKLSKRQCVEFALYCAKDVFHLVEDQDKERAKCCINLVEKWLIDENSVTTKEIDKATNEASYYCNVVYTIVNAIRTAAHNWIDANHDTVRSGAWSAVNVWNKKDYKSNKFNEYLIIANSYLTKTNINCPNYEIEGKILYLIDELDENIFIKVKNKYYINMNGIENCPEYGFDTQQELLNELFNSKCLFWAFVRNWLDQLYKEESNVNS